MVGAGPERQKVVQTPGELIPAVRIDGLKQPQHDPDVHGQDVQFARDDAPEDGHADGADAQQHDLDGRRIFCCQSEGGRILVMQLVDVLVQWSPMQRPMEPVVPGILEDEEDGNLVGHGEERGKGNVRGETTELSDGMEEPGWSEQFVDDIWSHPPDLRKLDREMTE